MGTNVNAPKAVQEEVELLTEQNNGELTPEIVVSWARSHRTSALYRQFTWDDHKAAELYRLEQAGRIIRLCVTVVAQPRKTIKTDVCVRKYISLSSDRKKDGKTIYRPLVNVLSNKTQRQIMLADAFAELSALHRKYISLVELSPVWLAVEEAQKRTGRKMAS